MNGSPVGGPHSFLQPMDPPLLVPLVPQQAALVSAITPTLTATVLKASPGKEGALHLGELRNREGMARRGRKRRKEIVKDDLSEDYCFICKDGGDIRVCDFKLCLKSYHSQCLKKDDSFLESDERWTCDWHSCYNCRKNSTFKCFLCPYSSCRMCIGESELVKVIGTKGFCNNCFRLVKLIEENADVDSDGDKVDFDDTDTYEFLFKDYWEIVKEKERLALANLQAVDDLLCRGEKFKNLSDLDENFEEEEAEWSNDDRSDEVVPSKDFTKKQNRMKVMKEKSKSKKTYIGWASKELTDFLISLGKDTKQPMSQHDVYEIVKDHIQSKNLLRHDKKKKKHVYCDARLLALFRRKKVNFFKVYSLLEKHFAENDDSDDESSSFEEDDYAKSTKRQRVDNSSSKQKREYSSQPPKKRFASIAEANIKLVYLKRSLIVELMNDPKMFETKVVGCFVRRKSDPRDNYGHGPITKMYQLNQIIGVKKTSETYKFGDTSTDIVFCVSNYCKDVQLSMLSDDNFEEEECEDLRQLVKEGLFKRPSVEELKEKIKIIHEDMVKHSVKKELLKLDRLIERANEKGWRRELFDYIERKKLLNKPEEIKRLMKELPDVAVDVEPEATEGVNSHTPTKNAANQNEAEFQGVNSHTPLKKAATLNEVEFQGVNSHTPVKNATNQNEAEFQGDILSAKEEVIPKDIIFEDKSEDCALRTSLEDSQKPDLIITKEKGGDADPSSSLLDATNAEKITAEEERPETVDSKSNAGTVIIETDDEDEATIINPVVVNRGRSSEKIWNYRDPSGNVQGPFSIQILEYWMEQGFFDEDFRIWKASQSPEDAIPLGAALGLGERLDLP